MKAILVMDMPECCYDCPITVCDADNMSTSSRSADCHLRELPEKHITDARQVGECRHICWNGNSGWIFCYKRYIAALNQIYRRKWYCLV